MTFYLNSHGDLETNLKIADAKPIVVACMESLGEVRVQHDDYISGYARYGFVKVPFRISWISDSEKVCLTIQCESNDIWNHAGKKVSQRIKEVIRNHGNPGYRVDRLGLPKMALAGQVFLFILFILIMLTILDRIGFL